MRRLRVAVLMRPDLVPPDDADHRSERERHEWKTEYDVVTTLKSMGHEVRPLGVREELLPIRQMADEWKPHIAFNLLEEFRGEPIYDQNVVSYLELKRVPYTGCGPRGMVLARGKALAKKLLSFHRIRVPAFAVFPHGRRVRRPRRLGFPLIVKSLIEHSSMGIARASIVDTDEKLAERVAFVHNRIRTDAIAEQYIEGREIYVGVLGNHRLQVLPVWELVFEKTPEGIPLIATERVKHDLDYQKRHGIKDKPADDLSADLSQHVVRISKRIYRLLDLDGYARIDFRLTSKGDLYFLEANPNPEIAKSEEFAAAARHAGVQYPELLQKIVRLGLRRG